jgi:hypothetical protein
MPPKDLKEIPGFSQGVRVNAAQRMVKLNRPICPNSKIEHEQDRNGRLVPKEKGPDTQNCQLTGGKWWEQCEALGHNPYFQTRVWYTFEDIIEEDDKGRLIKKGEQAIKHEVTAPNIAQVANTIRINNGRGVQDAMEKKGFRRLTEAGYKEVCQFRNCQKLVAPAGISRKYGSYCSLEHLQLIAADAESIMLTQGALLPVDSKRAQQKRAHQLREISVGAVE